MYYINSFLVYSLLGFVMESALYKFFSIDNYSGFMTGPITPIYGFGVLAILIINKYIIEKIKVNRIFKILLSFLVFAVILTLLEFIGGLLLDKILNVELWNYTNKKYNIGKYICLELSLVWGLFSIIFIYILRPFMDRFIKRIPKKATYLFLFIFIVDLIYSVTNKY